MAQRIPATCGRCGATYPSRSELRDHTCKAAKTSSLTGADQPSAPSMDIASEEDATLRPLTSETHA